MSEAHYAALIRLQVAVSALQDLVGTARDVACEPHPNLDAETKQQFFRAIDNASDAIQILFGAPMDVPPALMRNWRDLQMVRDANRVLNPSSNNH